MKKECQYLLATSESDSNKEATVINCVIDGQQRVIDSGNMDEFSSFVDRLTTDLGRECRFISCLRVNGREIAPGSEWFVPRKLSGVYSVEVTTGSSSDLVLGALSQGETSISDLRRSLQLTVGSFRTGNDMRGGKLFLEMVNGLEGFVSLTGEIGSALQLDFTTVRSGGLLLSAAIDSLNHILLDIIRAQEHRDWVLLSDLLEYELSPRVDYWQEVYAMLRNTARESFTR